MYMTTHRPQLPGKTARLLLDIEQPLQVMLVRERKILQLEIHTARDREEQEETLEDSCKEHYEGM
jgi:hypothetical protein